jgi:hypothetical protein
MSLIKYLDAIDMHQSEVLDSFRRAKELTKAFGDEVPYPSEKVFEEYKKQVRDTLIKEYKKYDQELGEKFIEYRALMQYLGDQIKM